MTRVEYNYPPWDGKVTLCVDARRIKYCAQQLVRMSREDTHMHTFSAKILKWLAQGAMPSYEQRYALERMYRENVYKQRTLHHMCVTS